MRFHYGFEYFVFASYICTESFLQTTAQSPLHPLDPLTADEIELTSKLIKTKSQKTLVFTAIILKEPPKSILFPFVIAENKGNTPSGNNLPRKSFSISYEVATGNVYEGIVNLNTRKVESFVKMPSGGMPIYPDKSVTAHWTSIVMNNTEVQKRIKSRGVDLESVVAYFGGYDGFDNPAYSSKFVCQFYFFVQEFPNDNFYAHPFDFGIVFDIFEEKIISIDNLPIHDQCTVRDNNAGFTVPKLLSNYDSTLPGFRPGHVRADVKPLEVKFPNGPSYSVEGNEISWQKFKFRIGFNSREGLTLHNIVYKDGAKARPLFYRISVAELSVVYGDPRSPFHRKQILDESWYGLGNPPNSLVEGQDCIGTTAFFNATIAKSDGSFRLIPNAACLTEEDDGILWKHTNDYTSKTSIARSRRLTITSMATIGNYEYIFMWHFYQDAMISFEVRPTGIVFTRPLAKGATPFGYGSVVFPRINAPYHQHNFAVRIDPMIDGQKNTVSTLDVLLDDEDTGCPNTYGNAFHEEETILKTAGQARTNVNWKTGRTWKISNENRIHPYTKEPVGYKLVPMNAPPLLLKKSSPVNIGHGYAAHSIWVTPYEDGKFYPGGAFYVDGNGLPEWVEKNNAANVRNEDIVIWHTFTQVHIPRVEDFPVMPRELNIGFTLKPYNFFLDNPALDVP